MIQFSSIPTILHLELERERDDILVGGVRQRSL
jgi:hypothetical protein